ncbi:hypothetical protein [Nonomuraea typhae]|uniref:Transposase n=1 Tax=Nonomuraea typhae TaxID=2603600 RepID=A0ABW7YYX5_9ACTN
MDIDEVRHKYGNQWEILTDLVCGVGAARWRQQVSEEDFQRGVQVALLAHNLDELAAKLEQQAALTRTK